MRRLRSSEKAIERRSACCPFQSWLYHDIRPVVLLSVGLRSVSTTIVGIWALTFCHVIGVFVIRTTSTGIFIRMITRYLETTVFGLVLDNGL